MKIRFPILFILLCFIAHPVYSQFIDGGTYPGICAGDSIILMGAIDSIPNDANDFCAKWIAPDSTIVEGLSMNVAPMTNSSYLFEVAFNNGDIYQDSVTISVCHVEIHPIDLDFDTLDNIGKIIIWTDSTDNIYSTTTRTSKNNLPAQSEDGKVHITVHITPANENLNKRVYFRLINPDLDDASSYDTDTLPNDNRDMINKLGSLSVTNDITVFKNINGNNVAAAETVLTITDQYSGDNYQVEASLDSTFTNPAKILKTEILVAWKRIYVEEDKMYRYGATLINNFTPDANTTNDTILVDNTSDFAIGDTVELFDIAGSMDVITVINVTPTSLITSDISSSFAQYSGVRISGKTATYDVPRHLFPDAYGGDAKGIDGGAFVEFIWNFTGSDTIPKYTEFPLDFDVTSFAFCDHWFDHSGGGNSIFQLVSAAGHLDGSLGTAEDLSNICFVTIDNHTSSNLNDQIADTAVHEFGHLFGVSNSHVDASVSVNNHETPAMDICIMSYLTVDTDGIAEFDLDCIFDIRDCTVPR